MLKLRNYLRGGTRLLLARNLLDDTQKLSLSMVAKFFFNYIGSKPEKEDKLNVGQ